MIDVVILPITYRCNCNCIMCSIPSRKSCDLPLDFYRRIFSDKKLNSLKSVNITGGEPFLRGDIEELVDIIVESSPGINEFIFSTNGTIKALPKRLRPLLDKYSEHRFVVSVSLDSVNEKAEQIRGIPGVHEMQMDTLMQLKKFSQEYENCIPVAAVTITSKNYREAQAVYEWVKKQNISIDFIVATVNTAYINSKEKEGSFVLSEEQKASVIELLTKVYKEAEIISTKNYYEMLIRKLKNIDHDSKECIFRDKRGVLIEADGILRVCGMDSHSYIGDLNEQSFSKLYEQEWPDMEAYCRQCTTNSYNSYSAMNQKELLNDILETIKKKRRNK